MPLTTREIREKYARLAKWYDWREGWLEWLGLARWRKKLLAPLQGQVLEVAAGTGRNFAYYPRPVRLTVTDLSQEMLERARRRAKRLGLTGVKFYQMDAARLNFPTGSFDAAVSTLALCTFSEPLTVLRELKRVVRPGSRILLLEHGRASSPRLRRWQARHEAKHAARFGCHLTRDPLELVREAELMIVRHRRFFWGIFYSIEAKVDKDLA